MEKLIQQLEAAWDENGFFDHLRAGLFNPTEASDFMIVLRSINLDDQEMIPVRLLSLIWYMPSFLDWQRDRVAEKGGDADGYARFITEVMNVLEEVIGVP
jgi:hypothetical protein